MISALSVAPRDTRFRTKASSVVFFLFSKRPSPSKAHALRHDVVFFFFFSPTARIVFVLP
jgi:hypothetical protein